MLSTARGRIFFRQTFIGSSRSNSNSNYGLSTTINQYNNHQNVGDNNNNNNNYSYCSRQNKRQQKQFHHHHHHHMFSTDTKTTTNNNNHHKINKMFDKILIANRGEIACRVIQTARKMGVKTVAIYSSADRHARHVKLADEAYLIGTSPAAAESYLLGEEIIKIAQSANAQAIHPGYGFLSENAGFCIQCQENNIKFIGPPVNAIEAMGSKSASKEIMINAHVPCTPGYHGSDQSVALLKEEAQAIGYPVLIKAVMGGGGKGMRIVENEMEFEEMLDSCKRESMKSFSDDRVLLEKYLYKPRHIEVQVFADSFGDAVYLFERDCSVQRRHQKVLEEAPAPGLSEALRKEFGTAAVNAAKAVGYEGAGTVEFLQDSRSGEFYFCEMNTRLQVEHPVTEMITGQDLVEWQLRVAAGEKLPKYQEELSITGHAIEARVYAENPSKGFLPATGKLRHLRIPNALNGAVRVDTGVLEGDSVTMYYDPMISKLIAWGVDREQALQRLLASLQSYEIVGVHNNLEFLERAASHQLFVEGKCTTAFLEEHADEVSIPQQEPLPDHAIAISVFARLMKLKKNTRRTTPNPMAGLWAGGDVTQGTFRMYGDLISKMDILLINDDIESVTTVEITSHRDGSYSISNNNSDKVMNVCGEIDDMDRMNIVVDGIIYDGTVVVEDEGLREGASVHIWNRGGKILGDTQKRYMYEVSFPKVSLGDADEYTGGATRVVAPMPGKIVKLMVSPGDTVNAGDNLMILEAMKMEHVISAPMSGVIESVPYQEGEQVEDGANLVSFEITEDDKKAA